MSEKSIDAKKKTLSWKDVKIRWPYQDTITGLVQEYETKPVKTRGARSKYTNSSPEVKFRACVVLLLPSLRSFNKRGSR